VALKVCKFGGSSVSCSENFKRIKEIILSNNERKVIVVSALGKRFSHDEKITDLLINVDSCAKNGGNYTKPLKKIEERFLEIKRELCLTLDIKGEFALLEDEIANGKSCTDFIVSRGEYLTAKLVAEYLGFTFVDSVNTLVFDYTGRLNESASKRNLRKAIDAHKNVVLPGFYGGYPNGSVKLFVRGGGDISGAIVASLLNAEVYENWTDVDGVMTANPQIISTARCVSEVTYEQFEQMSLMGASVVNDRAVEISKNALVPINVRNTFNLSCKGTVVASHSCASGAIGVTGKKGYVLVEIQTENKTRDLQILLSVLKKYRIANPYISCGINTITAVVEFFLLRTVLNQFEAEFKNEFKTDIYLQKDVAIVNVTMSDGEENSTSERVIAVLKKNEIPVKSLIKSSFDCSILIVIDGSDYEKTLKTIHNALFE